MFIKIPFQIHSGKIDREKDINKSINEFIELLVSSHLGSFTPDGDFGFIFINFKFEIFNEKKGTISYLKKADEYVDINYTKKISETSKNMGSFAYDLKRNIEKHEQRLKNVEVNMKYNPKEIMVTLEIIGKLNNERSVDYNHKIVFQVW